MSALQHLARKTLDRLPPSGVAGDGPPKQAVSLAVIMLILEAIVEAYKCWTLLPTKALAQCNNPGLLNRLLVRRIARRVLTGEGVDARLPDVLFGLYAMGRDLTLGEMRLAVAEARYNAAVRGWGSVLAAAPPSLMNLYEPPPRPANRHGEPRIAHELVVVLREEAGPACIRREIDDRIGYPHLRTRGSGDAFSVVYEIPAGDIDRVRRVLDAAAIVRSHQSFVASASHRPAAANDAPCA